MGMRVDESRAQDAVEITHCQRTVVARDVIISSNGDDDIVVDNYSCVDTYSMETVGDISPTQNRSHFSNIKQGTDGFKCTLGAFASLRGGLFVVRPQSGWTPQSDIPVFALKPWNTSF